MEDEKKKTPDELISDDLLAEDLDSEPELDDLPL